MNNVKTNFITLDFPIFTRVRKCSYILLLLALAAFVRVSALQSSSSNENNNTSLSSIGNDKLSEDTKNTTDVFRINDIHEASQGHISSTNNKTFSEAQSTATQTGRSVSTFFRSNWIADGLYSKGYLSHNYPSHNFW